MEQISLFDSERIYTQEDLNNAVVKALTDMTEVLERMRKQIKELQTLRIAYELMAKDFNSLVSACKVSFENCPRTNGTDVNRKCYECWQEYYIDKAREAQKNERSD